MSKIYLAIPYTGMEEKSFNVANIEAGKLMQLGHVVYSPISQNHPIAKVTKLPTTWDYWENFDREFIEWADQILVICMDGWIDSTGVQAEIRIAKSLGKNVVYKALAIK